MRQFVSDEHPDARGFLTVTGQHARHLVAVLRVAPGDMLYVRLPGGILQTMTVVHVESNRRSVQLQIAGEAAAMPASASAPPAPRAPADLWLFQFAAKPPKMDVIIRQATECGVTAIVPVAGTFCQNGAIESAKKKSDSNDNRWRKIITEAREQSGSAAETRVLPCSSLRNAVVLWQEHVAECGASATGAPAIVLYERTAGTAGMHQALSRARDVRTAALFVGAEGGIAPEEIEYMQRSGVMPVHFATNILRCETAALYGIAALQNALVEMDIWQSKE